MQQKYHWGDFGSISVRDPLSGTPTGYGQFKKFLAANLAGITVDLRQGQIDNARKQFEGFRARFAALGGSCGACHENRITSYNVCYTKLLRHFSVLMNWSIVIAGRVMIWMVPLDPSDTEIFAIDSLLGASTTFTKS